MDFINNLLASLFEWFGLNPFYSGDLGKHLRGYNTRCIVPTKQSSIYTVFPSWYIIIGFLLLALVLLCYFLQYHLLDRFRFNQRKHWWIFALILFTVNWIIGFVIPFNDISGKEFCKELQITTWDAVGFGFTDAIYSFLFYLLLTSFPFPKRYFSNNCRHTTCWKP